ncbi:MAG: putative sugar nucleotidyl transferase [Planctomycetota bacterium]
MNLAIFEDHGAERLLPLVWLRAPCELRCGRDRLIDKVRAHFPGPLARLLLRESLRAVISERLRCEPADPDQPWLLVNARALVTGNVAAPPPGTAWHHDGDLVAAVLTTEQMDRLTPEDLLDPARLDDLIEDLRKAGGLRPAELPADIRLVRYLWDIIEANETELRRQCRPYGSRPNHQGSDVHPAAHLVVPEQITLARGVRIKPGAVLDAEDGPIVIDRETLVEPNAVIQGPCYIGPCSIVRPGAALRGGASIGPVCKVGGEIEASIIHGYSNKQHDGFLGHSYVGEWVNLGADTITSDLKNTYGTIRVSLNGVGVETGRHFLGAMIGDHSKTGIGTILPTGVVIGVAANVFTQSGVPKFVPSFAWLTQEGLTAYRVEKALQIAQMVMGRRELELSDAERRLLEHVAQAARQVERAGWAETIG